MWKIFLILAIIFVSSNAKRARAEITVIRVSQNDRHGKSAIFFKQNRNVGDIKWNKNITKGNPPIAAFVIRSNPNTKEKERFEIEDICSYEGRGTRDYNIQRLILKLVTNDGKCPIKVRTKVRIPSKYIYRYSAADDEVDEVIDILVALKVPYFDEPAIRNALTLDLKANIIADCKQSAKSCDKTKKAVAELNITSVQQNSDRSVLSLKKTGKTGLIYWTKEIQEEYPPVSAIFKMTYPISKMQKVYKIDYLCSFKRKATHKYNYHRLIKNLVLNNGTCPPERGTPVAIPENYKYHFNAYRGTIPGNVDIEITLVAPWGDWMVQILVMNFKAKITLQ